MRSRQAKRSSIHYHWKYDVFVSFRGEDTRLNFIEHLYYVLNKMGIHTFTDENEIIIGDKIPSTLLKAIQESRMAIVVFSKEYASSMFCLDELVQIYQYIHRNGRVVLPIFYNVEPSEVRDQRGKYGQALVTHKRNSRADEEKIQQWKDALHEVASLEGISCDSRNEAATIKRIVNRIVRIINKRNPLDVAASLIGLTSHIEMVVKVWRFIGYGSSITGFICFALGPSFQKLFGRWNLWKIVVYCILSSMFPLFIHYADHLRKRFHGGFLLKALVSFLVLLSTSLCSYYDDLAGNKDRETEGKGYRNILSLISFGSFALMSMSLSIQLQPGFEVGMSNFFLGCLALGVMKKNLLEGLGVSLLCFIVMIIQSYSAST